MPRRAPGFKHSEDTKAKMRAAALGRKWTQAQREKVSAAMKGNVITAEQRKKISDSLSGRKKTDEHKRKASEASRAVKRKPLSIEHRAKLRDALKGKKRPKEVMDRILENWCPGRRVEYKGISFKSTYETRLAKAFDALGIQWLYEKKRFDLGDTTYTPDFYLPDQNLFYETKGYLGQDGMLKVFRLREIDSNAPIVVATKRIIEAFERAAASKGV